MPEERGGAFVRDERVLWRHVYDGVLLCLPGAGELVTVSGPGADLWEMLDQPHSITALTQRLAQRYSVDVQEVAADIQAVIDLLDKRAAIRPVGLRLHDQIDGTRQIDSAEQAVRPS